MRIAVLAPLVESVPPALYGGTERVVSVLTEQLVRRGHEVTLFASGDSRTAAELVPVCARSLRLAGELQYSVPHTLVQLAEAYGRAGDFDIVHNHVDYFAFAFSRMTETPTITTTHGRLDGAEIRQIYGYFREQPLVSISDAQRLPLPGANWRATIHNAIDLTHFHFNPVPSDYLVFLGRIHPEKRPDRAIEIARDVGKRLVIAAKVDPADQAYFEHAIQPMIRDCPLVEYIGEVNEAEKDQLLGGAYAYLFPIDWPEPFGLTAVEAMATGTPVVAYRAGSVAEIIVDGVTGFICESFHEMIEAVPRVALLDRAACRDHVEATFSPAAMTDEYERVYRSVVEGESPAPASPGLPRSATASGHGRSLPRPHTDGETRGP
ncbi:MAG TPA: glycosyltransferase family 4 protein [Chloroflexota bacterium]|nr:glycosyltransferase family 4 protein [Chloroflexota bacterium]